MKFLQHALSRYVYNRSLFDIFTCVKGKRSENFQAYWRLGCAFLTLFHVLPHSEATFRP